MAVESTYAPYAPKKTVMQVMTRFRERGLPDPLTTAGLEQVGVPASMAPRTMQALKFLGLVDESGYLLEPFKILKRATTEEYQGQLAEIVQAAYLPVFTIVNPSEDSDVAISDAFRQYEPGAQRKKMVTLFRGLCEEAGIIPSQGRPARGISRPKPEPSARRPTKPAAKDTKPTDEDGRSRVSDSTASGGGTIDYHVISAIIQQLPREARWSPERRERWLKAMTAAIDLLIEVESPATVTYPNPTGDDRSRPEELVLRHGDYEE